MDAIASAALSNTASFNVYDIDYSIDSRALCGINDEEPIWCNINMSTMYEGETMECIEYGDFVVPLSCLMRI